MATFEIDFPVARAAGEVFDRLNDVPFMLRWETSLSDVSSDPAGAVATGTVIRKESRLPGGRRLSFRQRVIAFDPQTLTRQERVIDGLMTGTTASWTVAPDGEGSRLRCAVDVPGKGLGRVVRPVLWRSLRGRVRSEIAAFKRLVEEEPS